MSISASPAYIQRSTSPADVSIQDFEDLKRVLSSTGSEFNPRPVRKPSFLPIMFTVLFLLIIYVAWAVWLYYYWQTHVWPLPRGPLNATDGLLSNYTILTKFMVAFLGLVSLVVPFVIFWRTRRPGRERSLLEFNGWILFCVVMALIPLLIYYAILCYMQSLAFSSTCDAGEDVTVYFIGSTNGLSGDGTTATLYSTANPDIKLGVYTLTSMGYSSAVFTRTDAGANASDYFRAEYITNENDSFTAATAFTSENGKAAYAMSGNLSEMHIDPHNATLLAIGEVMDTPLNFRLVDDSPVFANGMGEELGSTDVVLRTLSTNPWSCRSLKLCARSVADPEDRAKTLLAMGLALYKHAEYSFAC